MAWRWASASVIGTSHIQNSDRLQDAFAVSTIRNDCLFAIVSDGAGSARFGAYGAWLSCRFLKVRFRQWLRDYSDLPSNEQVVGWIEEVRERISEIALERGTVAREFAATLASVVVTPSETLVFHIGDSAVVGRVESQWDVLCWPENGEYASTTYFVTDEPEPRLNISRQPTKHDAFALFSDGVGDLALTHLEQTAHSRFFDPMLRPVDNAAGKGHLADLSSKLGSYLASPSVCERTDDDKTLILISGA